MRQTIVPMYVRVRTYIHTYTRTHIHAYIHTFTSEINTRQPHATAPYTRPPLLRVPHACACEMDKNNKRQKEKTKGKDHQKATILAPILSWYFTRTTDAHTTIGALPPRATPCTITCTITTCSCRRPPRNSQADHAKDKAGKGV